MKNKKEVLNYEFQLGSNELKIRAFRGINLLNHSRLQVLNISDKFSHG